MSQGKWRSDKPLKISLAGQSDVGKTQIINRITRGIFDTLYKVTVGMECNKTSVNIEGQTVRFDLWDLPAKLTRDAFAKIYFRNLSGLILVFDVTQVQSFNRIDSWITYIRTIEGYSEQIVDLQKVKLTLVGNKIDLLSQRKVFYQQASKYAKSHLMSYYQVSAKENKGIEQFFKGYTKELYNFVKSNRQFWRKDEQPDKMERSVIKLQQPPKKPKSKGCC